MAELTIKLEVFRYLPDTDTEPSFQTYEVPYNTDWVVLDAINYVKDHLDGTLTHRWSCRMGVCGSCGMMVDGVPKLTCHVQIKEFAPGATIRIEPLANFPVIRDLVVEVDDFLDKVKSLKPWLIPATDPPLEAGEMRQTPAELAAYKQFSMCINCMLCYAACPVYAMDDHFVGPAAIALAHRYNEDSRDAAASERIGLLSRPDGIWDCTFVGECSVVCPKGVDPAIAIQRSKLGATVDWAKTVLMPWGGK